MTRNFSTSPSLPIPTPAPNDLQHAEEDLKNGTKRRVLLIENHLRLDCDGDKCSYEHCKALRNRFGLKPIRRLTPISARAAALALAKHTSWTPTVSTGEAQDEVSTWRSGLDPKSYEQHLMSKTKVSPKPRIVPSTARVFDVLNKIECSTTCDLAAKPKTIEYNRLVQEICCRVFADPIRLSRSFQEIELPSDISFTRLSLSPELKKLAICWQRASVLEGSSFPDLNPFSMHVTLMWWTTQCPDLVYECLCRCVEKIDDAQLDSEEKIRCVLICIEALGAFRPSMTILNRSFRHSSSQYLQPDPDRHDEQTTPEVFENDLTNRLAGKVIEFIVGLLDPLHGDIKASGLFYNHIIATIRIMHVLRQTTVRVLTTRQLGSSTIIHLWCQHIFLKHWDGRSSLKGPSLEYDALLVLELTNSYNSEALGRPVTPSSPTKFSKYTHFCAEKHDILPKINAFSFAKVWTSFRDECARSPRMNLNRRHDSLPMMRFLWLFDTQTQSSCFRALCFLRMLKAVEQTRLNVTLLGYGLGWQRTTHGQNDPRRDWPTVPSILTLLECPSRSWPIGLRTALTRYLGIKVRRSHLLQDAFDQLWHIERRELLRPLKVQIDNQGENGADVGGVAQEFFSFALRDAFEPSYGIFKIDEQSRMAWFDPKSLEPLYKYELLGILIGLSLHNGFTLPVTFPLIFYKRLINPGYKFNHLEIIDGWPDLQKSLTKLLLYSDEVEDIFSLTYSFPFTTISGQSADVDMSKYRPTDTWSALETMLTSTNTSEQAPPVTNANRKEYILDYVLWLTDRSIRPQWREFTRGFYAVIPRSHIQMLSPDALKHLIEGTQTIDINALQKSCKYIDFDTRSATVKAFWAICHDMDDERRRDLLRFVTGSDRVPVGGIQGLDFTVQRNGPDSENLPTAATCFGRLLLPEYADAEKLKLKLGIALDNSVGFGNR